MVEEDIHTIMEKEIMYQYKFFFLHYDDSIFIRWSLDGRNRLNEEILVVGVRRPWYLHDVVENFVFL